MDRETLAALMVSAAERAIKDNKVMFEHVFVRHENEFYGVLCTLARLRAFEAALLKSIEQSLKLNASTVRDLWKDVEKTVLAALVLSGALKVTDVDGYYDMEQYKKDLAAPPQQAPASENYAEMLRSAESIVTSSPPTGNIRE